MMRLRLPPKIRRRFDDEKAVLSAEAAASGLR